MLVYLRDRSAQTILSAATLRQKLQIQLPTSPSHSILTPGRPVAALTLQCQASGRVATGVPSFKSLVRLDQGKSRRKRDSNPGSSSPAADALTTRPARRSLPVEQICLTFSSWSVFVNSVVQYRLHRHASLYTTQPGCLPHTITTTIATPSYKLASQNPPPPPTPTPLS